MLVTFIAFEAMAVGTAMPTAVAELDGLAWYGWPFSAFLVASVVGMVAGGDAGDRRGPRVALPWGVAAFAAGLLVAGLAGSMAVFVAGQVGMHPRRKPRTPSPHIFIHVASPSIPAAWRQYLAWAA